MKNSVINLMSSVQDCMTNSSGFQLFTLVKSEFENGKKVQISLKESNAMTSSFLNSSFGELLDIFGIEFIKKNLSLVDFKPSQAKQISEYLHDQARC